MLPDEDGADAGASGRAGGDPENDWWIAVVAGAAVGLGVLSVGFFVYARYRGKGKRAPTKKASVEDDSDGDSDGDASAPDTKAETKADAKSRR